MENTACFTGHRPDKLGGYNESNPIIVDVKKRMNDAVDYLISIGVTTFISGMALGVDTYAAEIVLEKKKTLPHIRLVAAVPFEGQERKWYQSSKDRFFNILNQCDDVVVVSAGGYSPYKMQVRNEWMVDRSTYVVAVWDGTSGGTGNCVDYIRKVNHIRKMLHINPTIAAPEKTNS